MNLPRSIALKLRDTDWWASNQGTIAGIAIGLAVAFLFIYLGTLIVGAARELFATLGFSHWHWWLGFGFFGLSFGVCAAGEDGDPGPRRCVVVPLRPAPRERIKAMGGGNTRVTAEDRWGRAA